MDSFSETVMGVPTPDLTGILLYHETTNTENGTFLGIIEKKLEYLIIIMLIITMIIIPT